MTIMIMSYLEQSWVRDKQVHKLKQLLISPWVHIVKLSLSLPSFANVLCP